MTTFKVKVKRTNIEGCIVYADDIEEAEELALSGGCSRNNKY